MRSLLRRRGHVVHPRGHLFGVETEGILTLDLRNTYGSFLLVRIRTTTDCASIQ